MSKTDRKTTAQEAPMVITPSRVVRLLRQIARAIRPSARRTKTG
jgi:hypothetical protein